MKPIKEIQIKIGTLILILMRDYDISFDDWDKIIAEVNSDKEMKVNYRIGYYTTSIISAMLETLGIIDDLKERDDLRKRMVEILKPKDKIKKLLEDDDIKEQILNIIKEAISRRNI